MAKMDKKDIIIIILSLIIIALLAIGAMHIVNDSQNGIEITSFNMGNESTMDLIGDGSQYLYTQESYKLGTEQINLSNHTVWYNRKDNNYIAFFSPENTSDNVIIVCKDNETMARMISTVKY